MLRLFTKTLKTGIVTERFTKPNDSELNQLGIKIKRHILLAIKNAHKLDDVLY